MTDGPRRTCVVCREVRDKRALVRLIRRPDGTVAVDRRAKMPGRGAYVCDGLRCVARLLKAGRLNQAFRGPCEADADLAIAVRAAGQPRAEASGSMEIVIDGINLMSGR